MPDLRVPAFVWKDESRGHKRRQTDVPCGQKPHTQQLAKDLNGNLFAGGGGRSSAARRANQLGTVLVITLENLAFSGEPVFRFVARFKSSALGHQVGKAANFVIQIDRE
jgi:hypothetical protein